VNNKIPYNKPYLHGRELVYIAQSVQSGKISGDGVFTKKCSDFFKEKYSFNNALLTTSCTDALEMCAILMDIKEGDEIIVPSYTFVSTANAFVMRGARIVFADSYAFHPNIDPDQIEALITSRTKAVVIVHYAGIACDMEKIQKITKSNNLYLIEDCAQSIDSYYKGIPLGSFGDAATFSFHETKNIISGEGGCIVINNKDWIHRSEIIREKGTDRSAFFRGEVDKYGWVDIGSSFLPSDIIAAYLYAQLEILNEIQNKRKILYSTYFDRLSKYSEKLHFKLPHIPSYSTNNAHIFYILLENHEIRTSLINYLSNQGIMAVSHYISLHSSKFYLQTHGSRTLNNSDFFTNSLLRLPLFYELEIEQVEYICENIITFLEKY
jgi:dTDP-4-amino-4,6-dideoxygalactose transaminase